MPWGAVAGAAINVIGGAMTKDKNGGAGTTSASKEPWSAAAPWLTGVVQQGTELNDYYNKNPFSAQQQAAYDNSYAQSDYMRGLIPSLLGQMQSQPLGYDKDNPDAKAKSWDWNSLAGGVAGQGSMTAAAAKQAAAEQAARDAAAAAKKKDPWTGDFVNQGTVLGGQEYVGNGGIGSGGFGTWRYGQNSGQAPEIGSQAYRDMMEYFNYGGQDPNNIYGRGHYGQNSLLGGMTLGSGNNSDGF
jgi:hypothetical protein